MTTASKVTILRILLIPLFMGVLLLGGAHSQLIGLAIFILAGATDVVDGYIARKYDQTTNFGRFMDPLADKLLMVSAMLIFVQWGRMPAWVLMVVLAREFAVSGLRMMAASSGTVIAAGVSGKIKTLVTFIGICFMLTPLHDWAIVGGVTVDLIAVGAILVTTVYSGVEYFVQNGRVLIEGAGE